MAETTSRANTNDMTVTATSISTVPATVGREVDLPAAAYACATKCGAIKSSLSS